MAESWPSRVAAARAAPPSPGPAAKRFAAMPADTSTLADLLYWARYKAFWFQALSRVLAINGAVGAILWGIDQATHGQNQTLLAIRSDLPLTLFVASLVALAYAVGRMAAHLDPERPFRNAAQLVLILLVIVGVTSMAGPVFVAIGEASALVLLLLILRLRNWQGNAYFVLRVVLITASIILLGGLGSGIATGQLLDTRFSLEAVDGLLRLIAFLLGFTLYLLEERRYWWSAPPTPVVIEQLQRACKEDDFGRIHRWLGEKLTFSQTDQRLLAELILPRRLIVDGDVAVVPAVAGGDLLFFRVKDGQVAELRAFEPK